MKKLKQKRVKPPKTKDQEKLEDFAKKKKLKGVFLTTPAVNYLGRGAYLYSGKLWKEYEKEKK